MILKNKLKRTLLGLFAMSSFTLSPISIGLAKESEQSPESKKEEIEKIVVSARKTEETLIETPVAVSVLDAEFFDKTGINTVDDMVKFVSGFDYSPTNTTRANGTKIRGISTFSFSDGFESSVATVVDGVVMGREAQGFFDLFDLQSIEVIKGPQGTLFGKNASAGVVNVRTKNPSFDFGAAGDVTYGSFNQKKIRGSITGPMTDSLAYRFTGTLNQYDGKTENALEGQDDINDKDTWSLRSKFLYDAGEDLEAILTFDTVDENNHCCTPTYRFAGPSNDTIGFIGTLVSLVQAVGSDILTSEQQNFSVSQLQASLDSVGITADGSNRKVAVLDDNILQKSSSNGVALQVNYDLDFSKLSSITAWRDWEIDEFNEADGLSLSDVNNRNGTISSSEQFSQEFNLYGSFYDGNVDYVTGLYYFQQDLVADGTVFVELPLAYNSANRAERTVETTSFAAFGEFTIHLDDNWSLILGGRYTDEKLDATYTRSTTAAIDWTNLVDLNDRIPLLPPELQGAVATAVALLPGVTPLYGADFSGEQVVNETDFSGRSILRYLASDSMMAYVAWSRGYKGPGIDVAESANANFIAEPGGLPVLAPEIPTLWELGMKGSYFENSLTVNTVLFHQKVNNLQTISNDGTTTRNLSIGEVLSRGLEADIYYYPQSIQGLGFSSSITYLDVSYEEFAERPELVGKPFADVPQWAISLTSDYEYELGNTGYQAFLRGEYTWQSEKNTSVDASPSTAIGAYGVLNLRAGFISPDETYKLTFAVKNATDVDYPSFVFGSTFSALDGVTRSQYLADPRTYSVTLAVKF